MGALQRVVDVARLRVRVVGPRQPVRTPTLGQFAHLLAAPVVEEIRRARVPQCRAARERRLHDLDRLVVGADEDVDGPSRRGGRRRFLAPVPSRDREEHERQPVERLDEDERGERDRVRAAPGEGGAVAEPGHAPHEGDHAEGPERDRVVLPPTADARLRGSARADVAGAGRDGRLGSAGAPTSRCRRGLVGGARDRDLGRTDHIPWSLGRENASGKNGAGVRALDRGCGHGGGLRDPRPGRNARDRDQADTTGPGTAVSRRRRRVRPTR